MEDSSRYKLISSFYGPGTVGCWLVSVCSILISWILNTTNRHKNTPDCDFVAVLLFPAIAGRTLDLSNYSLPGTEIRNHDPEDESFIPYAANIEASVNVCETFSFIALCLFPIAAYNHNRKRALSILLVGLQCFGSEAALCFVSPTVDLSMSNFT